MNKKRYSIDDLGKFDGSKMTIKVNGKQIYPQKRYAIVRIDNNCPMWTEKFNSFTCEDMFRCSRLWQIGQDTKCRDFCRYGDTKEQLIRKVATVLRRNLKVDVCSYKYKGKMRKLETIRFKGKGRFDEIVIELEGLAKEIVEFLGVEE